MDFKSLMASRIASAKPSSTKSVTTSTASNTSKYQRRGEIEAKREQEYAAEQARLEREREERQAKKRKLEEEETEQQAIREEKKRKLADESRLRREQEEAELERQRRKRLGLPEVASTEGTEADSHGDSDVNAGEQPDIPDEELCSKLRSLSEPATLYSETHATRLKRYYSIIKPKSSTITKSTGPIPTTLEPVPGDRLILPTTIPPPKTAEHNFIHRQLASYFNLVLSEWNNALLLRSPATSNSTSGKTAMQTYLSVLRDLSLLFRKLESQTLSSDLFNPIVEIARLSQQRRYVDANDAYLRLSIGKAAWPIGVTMVGIHERSAREKLHDGAGSNKAHILSDEGTRKMLQSIKRCLSFAQTRWAPFDIGQLMG